MAGEDKTILVYDVNPVPYGDELSLLVVLPRNTAYHADR